MNESTVSDALRPDTDLEMPRPPSVSPEMDAGLRRHQAMQNAAADAAALAVDTHLLRGITTNNLPSESAIDAETARLQAEIGVTKEVNQVIGEVMLINAETTESLSVAKADAAAQVVANLQAAIAVEREILNEERTDPDGTSWFDDIPANPPTRWHKLRKWLVVLIVVLAESYMSYLAWQFVSASGDDWTQVLGDLSPVALSALVLAGLPHLFVPAFARARRGGARSGWGALLLLVPLIAAGLAAIRTTYIADSSGGEPALGFAGMFTVWFLMFLSAPVFVFVGGIFTHNPHRDRYLELIAQLEEAKHTRTAAMEVAEYDGARVKRAVVGRDANRPIHDHYRDHVIPAVGEDAKAVYRRELSRQLHDPEFTGALVSRGD